MRDAAGEHGWDGFLTPRDREVFARAGYGRTGGYGERPAVLVVDATEEFCGPDVPVLEAIEVAPLASGEAAWTAVRTLQPLLRAARARRIPVLYSVMEDRSGRVTSWSAKRGSDDAFAVRAAARPGQVVRALQPLEGDLVIAKAKASVFHGTQLHDWLTERDVDTLIVCGGTTSGCVRATAVDAFSYGYRTVVVQDACFDRGEASHWMSLFDLQQKYADVVPAASVVQHLTSGGAASGGDTAEEPDR